MLDVYHDVVRLISDPLIEFFGAMGLRVLSYTILLVSLVVMIVQ